MMGVTNQQNFLSNFKISENNSHSNFSFPGLYDDSTTTFKNKEKRATDTEKEEEEKKAILKPKK